MKEDRRVHELNQCLSINSNSLLPPPVQQQQQPPPPPVPQQQQPPPQQQQTGMDVDADMPSSSTYAKRFLASLSKDHCPAPPATTTLPAFKPGTPWRKAKVQLPRSAPPAEPDPPRSPPQSLWSALPTDLNGALNRLRTDSPELLALAEWAFAQFHGADAHTAPKSTAKKDTNSSVGPGSKWRETYQRQTISGVDVGLKPVQKKNWIVCHESFSGFD